MRPIDADDLKRRGCKSCGMTHKECYMVDACFLREIADETPTLDVRPVVHAEWKEIKEYEHDKLPIVYECSECGYQYHTQKGGKFKHCPDCGVKMEGEKNA